MSRIFDNHIAVLDSVPVLGNFDEFLDRDHLDCPLPGCGWAGEDLGHHVAMSHGMPAAKFKERCGFNSSTGLVGRALSKRLSDRARETVPFSIRGNGPAPGGYTMRPEAAEHYEKFRSMRNASTKK